MEIPAQAWRKLRGPWRWRYLGRYSHRGEAKADVQEGVYTGSFQAGESENRRDQVLGGKSQEAGKQGTQSGQSLGHEATDTRSARLEVAGIKAVS